MADVSYQPVVPTLGQDQVPGAQQIRWPGVVAASAFTTTSVGIPYLTGSYTSISIHVHCTTWNAGTVAITGSNELVPTVWAPLRDAVGSTMVFTTDGVKQLLEHPVHIRPELLGAGVPDATSLFVIASLSTQARK